MSKYFVTTKKPVDGSQVHEKDRAGFFAFMMTNRGNVACVTISGSKNDELFNPKESGAAFIDKTLVKHETTKYDVMEKDKTKIHVVFDIDLDTKASTEDSVRDYASNLVRSLGYMGYQLVSVSATSKLTMDTVQRISDLNQEVRTLTNAGTGCYGKGHKMHFGSTKAFAYGDRLDNKTSEAMMFGFCSKYLFVAFMKKYGLHAKLKPNATAFTVNDIQTKRKDFRNRIEFSVQNKFNETVTDADIKKVFVEVWDDLHRITWDNFATRFPDVVKKLEANEKYKGQNWKSTDLMFPSFQPNFDIAITNESKQFGAHYDNMFEFREIVRKPKVNRPSKKRVAKQKKQKLDRDGDEDEYNEIDEMMRAAEDFYNKEVLQIDPEEEKRTLYGKTVKKAILDGCIKAIKDGKGAMAIGLFTAQGRAAQGNIYVPRAEHISVKWDYARNIFVVSPTDNLFNYNTFINIAEKAIAGINNQSSYNIVFDCIPADHQRIAQEIKKKEVKKTTNRAIPTSWPVKTNEEGKIVLDSRSIASAVAANEVIKLLNERIAAAGHGNIKINRSNIERYAREKSVTVKFWVPNEVANISSIQEDVLALEVQKFFKNNVENHKDVFNGPFSLVVLQSKTPIRHPSNVNVVKVEGFGPHDDDEASILDFDKDNADIDEESERSLEITPQFVYDVFVKELNNPEKFFDKKNNLQNIASPSITRYTDKNGIRYGIHVEIEIFQHIFEFPKSKHVTANKRILSRFTGDLTDLMVKNNLIGVVTLVTLTTLAEGRQTSDTLTLYRDTLTFPEENEEDEDEDADEDSDDDEDEDEDEDNDE